MTRHFSRVLDLLTIASMLFVVTACVPSSAPRYMGDITKEPKNMTPFEQGSVRMKLPPGYESKPLPPNAEEELLNWFQKKGSSANFQVYCYGGFFRKIDIHLNLLKTVVSVMPNAVKVTGPYSVGGSSFSPEFDGWTGTITAQGQEVPMNIYLAWKLNSRFGGCKYGLFAVVAKNQADEFFPEFVAIVRSLR